jgi:UDP-N-acetylmuramoyl-tripeptide--D-alanyl-D-alanine ligase
MKSLARWYFQFLARFVLRRYRPTVIGVAGSIGKTATKEAIAAGLDDGSGQVRKTEGSFNAEIGVPVTIISGGRARKHWWEWLGLIWLAKRMIIFKRRSYPKFVVLEMGADKPGDLERLIGVAKPQIGVLTAITPEHLEYFGSMEAVTNEESMIVTGLPGDGVGIVNVDEPNAAAAVKPWPGRLVRYGWSADADVRVVRMELERNDRGLPIATTYHLTMEGAEHSVRVVGVLGKHQALPIVAAVAVAHALGQSIPPVLQRLQQYQPPPGRMRLLDGMNGTLIIDDSYNASPAAMEAAIKSILELEIPGRRFAVLGQMSELGSDAARWHDQIGELIRPGSLEGLVTVGPLAERIAQAAVKKGFAKSRVHPVETAEAAAVLLQPLLRSGDTVLLKGSRYASRLEQAVKILLAYPERDQSKLVQ